MLLLNAQGVETALITGFAALFIILLSAYCGLSVYVIKRTMLIKKREDDFIIEYQVTKKKMNRALLDIPYAEKRIRSDYGYELHGRLYMNENKTDKFIFSVHGHNSSGIGQLKYLKLFWSAGYNVFIPDHRRSGQSGGTSITFGHYEKYDIIKWLDVLGAEFPNAKFAVYAESMGAATSIMAAALDSRIRFLIEYCGYASFNDLLVQHLKSRALVKFLSPGVSIAAKLLCKASFKEINPEKAIKKITVPVLIMHGRNDEIVGFNNAEKLMAAKPDAETVIFDKDEHTMAIVHNPAEFTGAVTDFIKKCENSGAFS